LSSIISFITIMLIIFHWENIPLFIHLYIQFFVYINLWTQEFLFFH
jgi:hypothetical protein